MPRVPSQIKTTTVKLMMLKSLTQKERSIHLVMGENPQQQIPAQTKNYYFSILAYRALKLSLEDKILNLKYF
jgi:hypothetical protein